MKYLILLSVLMSSVAFAKIRVVTTMPDIAEAARAIGGDHVDVQSLLQGKEDPHYAEARPDFILKVNRADIVCSLGLELEVGWLPKVLSKSGNAKVQDGGAGNCVLGRGVSALDIPKGVVDRSLGDVHIHGNPHFTLAPVIFASASQEILKALQAAAPDKASDFQKNYDAFTVRMTSLQNEIADSLKKNTVMEYHKEFSYFFHAYSLKSVGSLEEKPGMPPSAARLAQVAKLAKDNQVKVLFASTAAPHKVLEKFQELSGVKVVIVPSYVQNRGDLNSIEALQKKLRDSLNN